MITTHRECGEIVHVEMRCDGGHELAPREVIPRPGPGIRPMIASQDRHDHDVSVGKRVDHDAMKERGLRSS